MKDCGGWWLSGCCSSVAEHWLHKPSILGLICSDCRPFHFPLSSKFSLFQCGKIHQAFSLRFYILQAIKNWRQRRPGNEGIPKQDRCLHTSHTLLTENSLHCKISSLALSCSASLINRPHPLTRRNGLVNEVKFCGLVHTFATVSPSNFQNVLRRTHSKRYEHSSRDKKFLLL